MNHRELGKIKSTQLGYEDHGILTGYLHMDYGGSGQAVGGYQLSGPAASAFIEGCLKAGGVDTWEKLAGRTIYVLRESESAHSRVLGIENLPTEPGGQFLFASMYEGAANG